jgi:hypothetical protein
MDSSGGELRNEIPPTFVVEMRERGNAIPQVGLWWLRLARRLVANDPRDLVTLGKELAKHVEKKQPFDKGTLSRFIKGHGPVTFQLIQALGIEFSRLPPPIVFPDSYEEAVAILALHERYARTVVGDAPEAPITPLPANEDGRRRGKRAPAAVEKSSAPVALTPRRRRSGL